MIVAATGRGARCAVLGAVVSTILGLGAPGLARATGDKNCNGILVEDETDRLRPGMACVDYAKSGQSCTVVELYPEFPCDYYVAPGYGIAATCSAQLAIDEDGDGWGSKCDSCPTVANPDQMDSLGDGIGDACRCLTVTCPSPEVCHLAGACQPTTGKCTTPIAPDASACSLPHARAGCKSGACAIEQCEAGYADCDHAPADGCEARLDTVTDCGACGVACVPQLGCSVTCKAGLCTSYCPPAPTCDEAGDSDGGARYDLGAMCSIDQHGPRGCGVGGSRPVGTGGFALLASLLVLTAARRSRVRRSRGTFRPAIFIGALLGLPPGAHAQVDHVDVNQFHPEAGTARLFLLPTAEALPDLQLSAQAFAHYSDISEVITRGGLPVGSAVKNRFTTDVAIAVAFLRRYQLCLSLPVTLYQDGSEPAGLGVVATQHQGVEDLRLAGRARIAGNEWSGLGGSLEAVFPTGAADQYLGSKSATGSAKLFGHVSAGWLRAALMAGWRFAVVEERFGSVRSGNALLVGGGLAVRVLKDQARQSLVEITLEAWAQIHYSFANAASMPAEIFAAVHYRFSRWCGATLGVGTALDQGFGEPNVRVGLGLSCDFAIELPAYRGLTAPGSLVWVPHGRWTHEPSSLVEAVAESNERDGRPPQPVGTPGNGSATAAATPEAATTATTSVRAEKPPAPITASQWMADCLRAIKAARAASSSTKAARQSALRDVREKLNSLVEGAGELPYSRPHYIGHQPVRPPRLPGDPERKSDGHLTAQEVPLKLAEYDIAIALLDMRYLEIRQGTEGPWLWEHEQIERYREMFKAARDQLAQLQARGIHEDVLWYESPVGTYVGWVPRRLYWELSVTESNRWPDATLVLAERYELAKNKRGMSPLWAAGTAGLLMAGDFLGMTAAIELYCGKEALSERDLTEADKTERRVFVALGLGGLLLDVGGPRAGKWAGKVSREMVAWLHAGGPRAPFFLIAEHAAPLALTMAERAELVRAGLVREGVLPARAAPMMREGVANTGGGGGDSAPAKSEAPSGTGSSAPPTTTEPVARAQPEGKPWEMGEEPRKYERYRQQLARTRPWRKALPAEQWWEKYGKPEPHNPAGGEGKADHRAIVEKLKDLARAEFPDSKYRILSNRKAPGLNRRPDVTVIDRDTKRVVKVYEAARFDASGRLIRPDERAKILEYEAAGVPYEFHPVGSNGPPGGVLKRQAAPQPTPH